MRIILLFEIIILANMVATTVKAKEQKKSEQDVIERIEAAQSIDDLPAGIGDLFKEDETVRQESTEVAAMVAELEEGFVYYEIPEEYKKAGGSLPEDVQRFIYRICKRDGVRYALILAMIERESGYKADCIGDDGESAGYMQVQEAWHEERMEEKGVTDLLDPYQNIMVGVDYIKELIEKYGTIQDALAAYNYGEKGALRHLWNNGIFEYEYNETIMERMWEIEGELNNGI